MCHVKRHICSGTYANNVKCMYICVPAYIVNCIGFIRALYIEIFVSCVHELTGTCGLYVAFDGLISFVMYIAIRCFLSHDADGVFHDIIAFIMLR